jgi:hypothetical protein
MSSLVTVDPGWLIAVFASVVAVGRSGEARLPVGH